MTTMSPLRQRMIEDMTIRNLSRSTQQLYIYAVAKSNRSNSYVLTTPPPGDLLICAEPFQTTDGSGRAGIAGLDGIIDVVLEFRREIDASVWLHRCAES